MSTEIDDNIPNSLNSRPVSRRGMKEDRSQNSPSMGDNGVYSAKPRTASRMTARPPSAQGFPRRTASRMSSAMAQPPKTGQSIIGISNINVVDRPITQQGVTGLRTATARGPQHRQVLDKRYFEGLIRMKMKDIRDEIIRLNGDIEVQRQQQATSEVYEKRVREIASELTELQGQLADYNLVIDKINTNTDVGQIEAEAQELKNENDHHAAALEQLFEQNRVKEQQIQQLEIEIQNEKNLTEKLIEEMNPADKAKYNELKNLSDQLQREIEQHQQTLDALTQQKNELEDKISGSQIKQEAVRLYHKLREREERYAALLEEERTRSTPAQEREQLLQKVKEDNAEMAAMERQIAQINEQIKKKKEELELIEQDLEESQSDRHQKFKELKKREETMEQFLSTFDEAKESEIKRIEELEEKIVIALQQMSQNLLSGGNLPSHDEFSIMKENLSMKQEELEKSKLTVEELTKKQEQLAISLQKIEDLEEKIKNEMVTIREKMVIMTEEIKTFVNLDALRNEAQSKRDQLMKEREELLSKKPSLTEQSSKLQEEFDQLNKELNENETYIQLNNLEKKLEMIEQTNQSMREFIESKKNEMDYGPLKERALQLLNNYNQLLITMYSKKN